MAKSNTGQNIVKPSTESLAAAARSAAKKGLPPVHLWDPPYCGELDIEIRRDGTWFYLGTPIGRPALVKLFSSILKLEDGKYFLVTPVEKVGIRVQDAPFLANDVTASGQGIDQTLTFTTQVGDTVVADRDHPIRVPRDPETGEPSPYVMVRGGMEALIDRKSFYRLAELGETATHDGCDWFGVWSGGVFFPMIPAAELPEG